MSTRCFALFFSVVFIPVFALFSACVPESRSRTELALGTLCRIELFGGGTPELHNRLFSRLYEIERIMSANLADSEVSRINRAAGLVPVPVSRELFIVLERALYFAEASDGAFDPTIGPLVTLWGIGGDNPQVPGREAIDAARALVNWKELELKRETGQGAGQTAETAAGTAFLRRPGMALDLGAIAKGFAADELVKILREAGTKGAVIDLGGNIYVYGTKPRIGPFFSRSGGTAKWRVGIQNPLDDRGAYAGYVEVDESSVVTSGVYERFFVEDGKRYHHILDTRTGFPVENGLLAVTITSPSSMDADALSTAVFALGREKGGVLVETHAAGGTGVGAGSPVGAVFIFADNTIRTISVDFTLTDGRWVNTAPLVSFPVVKQP
ncbi:MAG: FAD:protein FMN transferase [Treponema sp.]|nr:FAD:protein FMN transferase [Treponema sp.]